ncbi:hypothetical protein GCM10023339_28750 [Alloalcanivorax gelatiniphagus]
MELNGVPLHPLVVHAVVVLGPLAALTGLVYAFVAKWRWLLRWPLVVLAVVVAVVALTAVAAGEDLLASRPELAPIVADHQADGELLRNVALGFVLVAGFGAWALGGASALASGRGARETRLAVPAMALLAIGSVALVVTVYLAGESGAKAVWG